MPEISNRTRTTLTVGALVGLLIYTLLLGAVIGVYATAMVLP